MIFNFQSSNGRTYKISFEWEGKDYNRFSLNIIGGGGIIWPGEEDDSETTGIAPFIKNGKIDWLGESWSDNWNTKNPNNINNTTIYSKVEIDMFVPADLKEYCEMIVEKYLVLI